MPFHGELVFPGGIFVEFLRASADSCIEGDAI